MCPVTTLVFLHAHPDDEALLTAGTMARAAAEGCRVVLVVATDGAVGLAASEFGHGEDLASVRSAELDRSAAILGVARVVRLGYADSGLDGTATSTPERPTFVSASVETAADAVAAVLREEQAEVLITYDASGGYGHPDHVHAHRVAVAAAALAQTPRVFEATVPRDLLLRGIRLASLVYRFPPEFDPTAFERAFTASRDITHRVNVSGYLSQKRASMAAHASQASADSGDRTLAAFLRMPGPLYRSTFKTEWFRLR